MAHGTPQTNSMKCNSTADKWHSVLMVRSFYVLESEKNTIIDPKKKITISISFSGIH